MFEGLVGNFNKGDLVKDDLFGACIFIKYKSERVAQVYSLRYSTKEWVAGTHLELLEA
mgnify:CR=1 FL=1